MNDRTAPPSSSDRLLDLLAEQAGAGLDDQRQAELDTLLRQTLEHSDAEFELAAASLAESFAAGDAEPMPEHLRERCLGSARAVLSEAPAPILSSAPAPLRFSPPPAQRRSSFQLGWLAAAACLMLAVFGWLPRQAALAPDPWINTTGNSRTMLDERRDFINAHAEAIVWNFAQWGEEYADVEGDVVWDPISNVGYMRFKGLPANDPKNDRYQLWIVDQARGTPLQVPPVDGGLFDIGSGQGEWVVKFHARLPVEDVFGFGITVEDPDGVVISDQSRKAVIATAPPPV